MSCAYPKLSQQQSLSKLDKKVQTSVEYLATMDSVAKILRTSQEKLKNSLDSVNIDFNNKLRLIKANNLVIKQLDIAILSLYISELMIKRMTKEEIEELLKE
jgi:hypothetical protein